MKFLAYICICLLFCLPLVVAAQTDGPTARYSVGVDYSVNYEPQQNNFEYKDIKISVNFQANHKFVPVYGMPNVVQSQLDQREYILVASQDGKTVNYIPLENAKPEEIHELFKQKIGSPREVFNRTLQRYPAEQLRFFAAQGIVQMMACYGGGLTNFDFKTAASSPTCVDNFLMSLVDWKGWVGFFAFMVGNDVTSRQLNNMMNTALQYRNTHSNAELLRRKSQFLNKMRPYFGYMGMAVGSMASEMVHHILTIPSLPMCMKLLAKGYVFESAPICKDVATHFASMDQFWHNFFAGVPALIGSAALSGITQNRLIKPSLNRGKVVATQISKGIWAGGQIVSSSVGLNQLEWAKSATNIASVRVLPELVQFGRVFGYFVRVVGVGHIGSMVVFFAWDHFLREPTTKLYWELVDGGTWLWDGIEDYVEDLFDVAKDIKEKGWTTPLLVEKCRRKRSRTSAEFICEKTHSPLSETLNSLKKSAERYRKNTIVTGLEEGAASWRMKWNKYLDTYMTGKILIQEIYRNKDKKADTTITTVSLGNFMLKLWHQALKFNHYTPEEVKSQVIKLTKNFYGTDDQAQINEMMQDKELKKRIPLIAKDIADLRKLALRYYGDLRFQPCHTLGAVTNLYLCTAVRELMKTPEAPYINMELKPNSMLRNAQLLRDMNSEEHTVEKVLRMLICDPNWAQRRGKKNQALLQNTSAASGMSSKLILPNIVKNREGNERLDLLCKEFVNTVPIPQLYTASAGDVLDMDAIQQTISSENENIDQEILGQLMSVIAQQQVDVAVNLNHLFSSDEGLYSDPLSYLMDNDVELILGTTEKEAQEWWNKYILKHSLKYYTEVIIGYQGMLDEKLLNKLSNAPAEDILGLENSNYADKIHNPWRLFKPNTWVDTNAMLFNLDPRTWFNSRKTTLNASQIGQAQVIGKVIDTLSEQYEKPNNIKSVTAEILLLLTEHTRHMGFFSNSTDLKSTLNESLSKLAGYETKPENTQKELKRFGQEISKLVFGNSKEEYAKRIQILTEKIDDLSLLMLGQKVTEIDEITLEEMHTASVEQISNFSEEEYKLYTGLQIISHLRGVLEEINNYYYNYIHLQDLFALEKI